MDSVEDFLRANPEYRSNGDTDGVSDGAEPGERLEGDPVDG